MTWFRCSSGQSANLGTKSIAANGTYNASTDNLDGYSAVTVNVPNPSTGTINITTNGTYDVTDKASAVVAVSGSLPSGVTEMTSGVIEPTSDIPVNYNSDLSTDNRYTITHGMTNTPNYFYLWLDSDGMTSLGALALVYVLALNNQPRNITASAVEVKRAASNNYSAGWRESTNTNLVEFSSTTIKFGYGTNNNPVLQNGKKYHWIAAYIPSIT